VIVLDTHVWIWWAVGSKKLGKRLRRLVAESRRIVVPATRRTG
jgi:PIN domain nuclease of toxin-antitoxin system